MIDFRSTPSALRLLFRGQNSEFKGKGNCSSPPPPTHTQKARGGGGGACSFLRTQSLQPTIPHRSRDMSQAAYAGVDTDGDHSARRVGLNLSGTARRQVPTSRVITFNVFIYSRYFCCLLSATISCGLSS